MIIALRNFVCIIGLIIILPVLCCITILIIIEDGFPPFFTQERLGMDKKIFKIYKIRTMKKNTPQLGTHEVKSHFQLRSGVLARSLKLDEFPQLINVIKGDINLIGPRPGLVSQTELAKERNIRGIFKVKPGITGLSQVLGYDRSNPYKQAVISTQYVEKKAFYIESLLLIITFK